MSRAAPLRARWNSLAPREKTLIAGTAALIVAAVVWLVLVGPALGVLRSAPQQHRVLDTQLQRVRGLQLQAQALQTQPKQNHDEALRQLESSVKERLGTSARLLASGDRATLTLTGVAPDALAQWLTQARVNARTLPNEAHLHRNAAGLWEGTLVLALPPR
ncbi:MAG TPA: type II secretion system protein GspM [Ramlibacter sp.]|jgi:general secretion pathway protein M|nr:type II secretion system protein GspM [Ramlibacter sp.]